MGTLKDFSNKLMVIAPLLNATSAYEKYHRNTLLLDSRENLYHGKDKQVISK